MLGGAKTSNKIKAPTTYFFRLSNYLFGRFLMPPLLTVLAHSNGAHTYEASSMYVGKFLLANQNANRVK